MFRNSHVPGVRDVIVGIPEDGKASAKNVDFVLISCSQNEALAAMQAESGWRFCGNFTSTSTAGSPFEGVRG